MTRRPSLSVASCSHLPTRADNSAKHGVLVAKNPTVAVICP
jgi:hypothetical protein